MSEESRPLSLEDVAEVILGQSPPGSTYNESGHGLPFIQGAAEFGLEHPVPTKWCSEPRKVADAGDLLFSVRAPVGRMNFAHERLAVGRGLAVIRGTDYSTRFLRLALECNSHDMRAASSGGMFESITGSALKRLPVPVVSETEQRRIVEVMEAVDASVRATVRLRDTSNHLFQALRSASLADADETPLGDLLMGIDAGRSPSCPPERPSHGEWGVLKVTAVRQDQYFPEEAKLLPPAFDRPERFQVNKGDVLVTRAGGNLKYVGVSCVVDVDPGLVMLCDKTLRLRVDESKADPLLLSMALGESGARAQLEAFATGSAGQLNISQAQFRQVKVRMPKELERQRELATTLSAARAVSRHAESKLRIVEHLRLATLNAVLTGGMTEDPEPTAAA